MYCSKCGKEVDNDAVICIHCGCAINNKKIPVHDPDDAPNVGFSILGFFFPIIGFFLCLLYRDSAPLKAKSAGKGALIGYIVNVVIEIIRVFYIRNLISTIINSLL